MLDRRSRPSHPFLRTAIFVAALVTWSVPGAAELRLSIVGGCPGPALVEISGATPSGQIVIASSPATGSLTIGSGGCAGTTVDLDNPQVLASLVATAEGTLFASVDLPASLCGQFLQAMDSTTCATSNVLHVGAVVLEIRGGPLGQDPVPGVRVLRNDPTTGALLDDQVTDASGIVDFGLIGAARTTLCIAQVGKEDKFIFSLADIPVGLVTLQFGAEAPQAVLNVGMTGVPAGSDVARVYVGGIDEGENFWGLTIPPFGLAQGVEVLQLQPDGLFSLVTTVGPGGGDPTGCGMVLDKDPTLIPPGAMGFVDTSSPPAAIPFTADQPVRPDGVVLRRKGLFFDLHFQTVPAVLSGSTVFCDVPGTSRYDFLFDTEEAVTQASIGVDLLFDTLPASLDVVLPDLQLNGLTRDPVTQTFAWVPGGADLVDIDVVVLEIGWEDALGSSCAWEVFTVGSATSFTLPELPADLAGLLPPVQGVGYGTSLFGLAGLTGFEELISTLNAEGGNFEAVLFASDGAIFADKSVRLVRTHIGGGGTGTVTVNGLPAADGDAFAIDGGAAVTVVATPTGGSVVSNFSCPGGPGSGDPSVQLTCTFPMQFDSDVFVDFD